MAIFITFERRRRWIGTSISRSFNIFVNDSQDLSKTPKALIDTLINLTSSYDDDSEATRGRYLFNLRSLFIIIIIVIIIIITSFFIGAVADSGKLVSMVR